MEFLKSLIELITSWFKKSTAQTKADLTLAEATESATINEIKAESNAHAVQQLETIEEDLAKLRKKHKKEKQDAEQTNLEDNNPFGDSW